MSIMEVLTLLLVIFAALSYIDNKHNKKQHPTVQSQMLFFLFHLTEGIRFCTDYLSDLIIYQALGVFKCLFSDHQIFFAVIFPQKVIPLLMNYLQNLTVNDVTIRNNRTISERLQTGKKREVTCREVSWPSSDRKLYWIPWMSCFIRLAADLYNKARQTGFNCFSYWDTFQSVRGVIVPNMVNMY